jgi:hypothetical protein
MPMNENVGMVDRMIRFIVAIIFIILGFVYSPWWFIVAAIALITALLGWCGLYSLFGWNTSTVKEVKQTSRSVKKAAKKKK